jgi:hypothetical protein
MIETTSANVKLTFEQAQQLAEMESRLSVIQNNTAVAEGTLIGIKKESMAVAKEKLYQETLLADLTREVEKKQSELSILNEQIVENQKVNDDLNEKSKTLSERHTAKEAELTLREKTLASVEQLHQARAEHFNNKQDELLKEKEKVQNAKNVISKAIETATW